MLKKLQAQPRSFRSTFNNSWNIGNNKAAQIITLTTPNLGCKVVKG